MDADQPSWDQGLPDPHTLGQQAAQATGNKPVAPALPVVPQQVMSNMANANRGIAPTFAAPVPAGPPPAPSADEPTWAATDTPPAVAAPAEASTLQNAPIDSPAFQQSVATTKAAQNAILQAKMDAVKTALGGAPFDPTTGDNSTWQRARMGLMSNATDRAAYLKDSLPAGSDIKVLQVPGVGPLTVFRLPGETAYHPVKGSGDGYGYAGDILSAAPAVAGQVGTAMATDGATLLPRMFVQMLAGGGERGAELLANQAEGYNSQSGLSDAADMAKSSAAASAGELGGAALSYGSRSGAAATGAALKAAGAKGAAQPFIDLGNTIPGLMKPTIEGEERLAAEARLRGNNPDVPPLIFDQLGHPLAEAKGQRLRAISSVLPNLDYQQQQGMAAALTKAGQVGGQNPAVPNVGDALYPGLQDVVDRLTAEAKAPLANVPVTEPAEGGRALANIYQNAIAPVMNRVSDKYGAVLDRMGNAPEQPNGVVPIDLSGTHAVIDKEAAPIYGQGVPEEKAVEMPVMGQGGLGEPVQLGTKTETQVNPTKVKTGGGISPALEQPVTALRSLNPQNGVGPMAEGTASPYEAVKPIYSQLGEKSVYNPVAPGADRATSNQAAAIVKPLSEAIDTAAGPQASAARNARSFAGEILDNPNAIKARENMTPESNMSLATPENSTFLKNTQRLAGATGQSDLYKVFQDAIGTGLARQPEKIPGVLEAGAGNPGGLNRMLTPESQGAFQQYAQNVKNLKSSLASQVSAEPDFAKRAVMMANGDMGQAADIIEKAGGVMSPMAQNTRAAMYQKLLADSTNNKSGALDMGKLAANAGDIASDPAAPRIFSKDDLQQMKDIQTYANAASQSDIGTGSSIMRSEVAGKMSLFRPDQWPSLIAATLEAKLQSHLYSADRAGVINRGVPTGIAPRSIGVGGAAYETNQKRQEPNVGGR